VILTYPQGKVNGCFTASPRGKAVVQRIGVPPP